MQTAAAAVAGGHAGRCPRTTRSAARTSARGSRCSRRSGRMVRRAVERLSSASEPHRTAAGLPTAADAYLLFQTSSAPGRSTRTARPRIPAEGEPRGKAADVMDRARRRRTRMRSRGSCADPWATAASWRSWRRWSRPLLDAARRRRARTARAAADRSRRPRPVPGRRAVGAGAGRSRQPTAGRLRGSSPAPGGSGARATPRRPGRGATTGFPSCGWCATPSTCGAVTRPPSDVAASIAR